MLAGCRYNGPGITATVYLYTLGLNAVPGDVNDPTVIKVFRSASNEIARMIQYGYYSNLKRLYERLEPMGDGSVGRSVLHGHCRYFNVKYQVESLSHLYLRSYRQHFFKIRYT